MDLLSASIATYKKKFVSSTDFPVYLQDIRSAKSQIDAVLNYSNELLATVPEVPEGDNLVSLLTSNKNDLNSVINRAKLAQSELAKLYDIDTALQHDEALNLALTYISGALGGGEKETNNISTYGGSIQYIKMNRSPKIPDSESIKQKLLNYVQNAEPLVQRVVSDCRGAIAKLSNASHIIVAVRANKDALEPLINPHLEFFNQAVWLERLSPAVVHSLFADKLFGEQPINTLIDPKPVAITGNMVGFAYAKDAELEADEAKQTSTVSIPTGGVFAEAVLGRSVAAEKIDLTRFWNWQESPIPLTPPELNPVSTSFNTTSMDLKPQDFSAAQAALQSSQEMPANQGLAGMLQAMASSDMFKDMSGKEVAQTLATAVAGFASAGEQNAQKIASQNFAKSLEIGEKFASGLVTAGSSTLLGGLNSLKDTGILEKVLGLSEDKVADAVSGKSKQKADATPPKASGVATPKEKPKKDKLD